MIIGLQVDYVVHLGEAYISAPYNDRLGRVKCMLESIGMSVVSGAVSTIGATSFLLAAQVMMMFQFGVFIIVTIFVSFIFSFFCFTTLMALCGPQNKTGCLITLFKNIRAKCRKVGK